MRYNSSVTTRISAHSVVWSGYLFAVIQLHAASLHGCVQRSLPRSHGFGLMQCRALINSVLNCYYYTEYMSFIYNYFKISVNLANTQLLLVGPIAHSLSPDD